MKAAPRGRRLRVAPGIAALILVVGGGPATAGEVVVPTEAVRAATADTNRLVALDVSACPADYEPAVRRIVGIEIGDLLLGPGQPPPAEGDRLSVACEGNVARISATGSRPDTSVERTLSITDFPGDAAPRALALAGIEALAAASPSVRQHMAARAGPAAQTNPPVSTGTPVVAASSPVVVLHQGPPPADSSLTVTLSAGWRWFPTPQGISAWGGRLAVDRNLGSRFNVALDLEGVAGNRRLPAGEVGGVLVSAGAFWGLRGRSPDVISVLALGARCGVVRLVGDPADAASMMGEHALLPWGGPAVSGRVLVGRGRLIVGVAMEVGVAVMGAKGTSSGDTALAVRGAWLALSVGAGIRRHP